ncbi:GNAT family N-acetyltransferase [Gillisia sp. M10.2A]|uniref:GNAT family N-acetyltransferase n=1 Tax=Gillisia lutea TaxID=2909668 RepID=A0ABS9EBS5_9FLAO|nr:GNAT family N-acetyltransferase [Gillisia lutea]MCF4100346.1 GNAT family N-acetyltransferase [Gillisia lutea]
MEYIIRKAEKQDLPQVLELIQELAEFEKEPEAVIIDVSHLEEAGFGPNPLFTCFVAEVNGRIEGMALVYFRFSTWKGRTLHLEDLVVRQKMRGTGLGSALYKKVVDFAISQGVKRAEWVVLDWNKPAIDFYKRSGAKVLTDWHIVQMDEKAMNAYLKI